MKMNDPKSTGKQHHNPLTSQVQDGKPSTCFGWILHPIQYLHILRYLCVIFIVTFMYVFICCNFRSLALLTDDHVNLYLVFSDKMAENGEVNTDHEGQKNG